MTVDQLRTWLRRRISEVVGLPLPQVDPGAPVAELGLTSEQAVMLAAELERLLGRPLGAELLYDHPTIDSLCVGLTQPARRAPRAEGAAATRSIAIIGIGCRFPGAGVGPAAFHRFLRRGGDAVSEVPAERWDNSEIYDPSGESAGSSRTRWGAFLDRIEMFDPSAFAIPPAEAARMDPQQRLLLEACWHAIEDAGRSVRSLAGGSTGVFVGVSQSEYARERSAELTPPDAATATGSALSIAANRVSYVFDLVGPSLAVDTACSSSLAAVHLACRSLAAGECDLALAGGVNAILSPDLSIAFTAAGLMSPSGRCKAFDQSADGYVRGEGVGMLLLKPLDEALRDGDRIYAQILGSAIGQDGRSNGLLAPRGDAQVEVIEAACAAAGIAPGELQMIEAHGTGTALGDVIEAAALGRTVGRRLDGAPPCLIGSVKTNIGHLEPAAGVAGLIKVALGIHHGEVAPSLHFDTPNPAIAFDDLGLEVCTRVRPWPDPRRLAGVSSFGFGGTNVHAVLAAAPARHEEGGSADGPVVFGLSAHDEPSLEALAAAYGERMAEATASEAAVLALGAAGRTPLAHRLAVPAASAGDLAAALRGLKAGGDGAAMRGRAGGERRLALVFCGQGAIWPGVARDLFEQDGVFRAALLRCDDALRPHLPDSVLPALFAPDSDQRLADTCWAQPALFALQVAMAEVVRGWGVEPVACVGHSVGEVAAAVVSGRLSLETAARIVAHRGRAMQDARGRGLMASVSGPAELIGEVVRSAGPEVCLAALNAPESVVVSGAPEVVRSVVAELSCRGCEATPLGVEYAFHSPQMEGPASGVMEALGAVAEQAGELQFYSTVEPGRPAEAALDAAYWRDNVRRPVRFREAIEQLLADRTTVFLEVGPHPVLSRDIQAIAKAVGVEATTCATLRRGQPGRPALAQCAARLFVDGHLLSLGAYDGRGLRALEAPPYPWAGAERHWIDRGTAARGKPAAGLGRVIRPAATPERWIWEGAVGLPDQPFLGGHRILGRAIAPATLYVDLFAQAAERVSGAMPAAVEDLEFLRMAPLPDGAMLELQLTADRSEDGGLEMSLHLRASEEEPWHLTARARARSGPVPTKTPVDVEGALARCLDRYPGTLYYQLLRRRGLDYRSAFEGLKEVAARRGEALGAFSAPANLARGRFRLDPAVVDSALQAAGAAFGAREFKAEDRAILLPTRIDRLSLHDLGTPCRWSHVSLVEQGDGHAVLDVALLGEHGRPALTIEGLRVSGGRRRAKGEEALQAALARWIYHVGWKESPRAAAAAAPDGTGAVLILAEPGGLGDALAAQWAGAGRACVLVRSGPAFRELGPGEFAVDPRSQEDLLRVLRSHHGEWSGIAHLWNLDSGSADGEAPDLVCAMSLGLLVRALQGAGVAGHPRLTVVTRGAAAVADSIDCDPVQAMSLGFTRTVALEHPDLSVRCVDLDPGESGQPDEAALLREEIDAPDDEFQVAFRRNGRFVARLRAGSRGQPDVWSADAEATYLVTGGEGALGRQAIANLIEQGAKTIVSVGRSLAEDWRTEAGPHGAQVISARCDVSDAHQVRRLFERLEALPRLKGVIHAAGVLDDCAVANLDRERLRTVVAPKALGAEHLLQCTRDQDLDFLVFYSSAASVLGAPGQANYCAANAYLDVLAARERARGRPVLSISWGPWSGEGMAAGRMSSASLVTSGLISMIPPELGADLLVSLLPLARSHVLVLPFNVGALVQFSPATSGLGFFSELTPAMASVRSDGAGAAIQRRPAIDTPLVEPRTEIEVAIVAMWQRALAMRGIGVKDDLFALGGDSVIASQILSQIGEFYGIRADPERAFETFTVEALAALVEELLIQQVDEMDDEAVEAMLATTEGA